MESEEQGEKGIREQLAEMRGEQTEMRVELKWTKWLAAGALGASTLGQVSNLSPPHDAIFDLIGRLM